MKGNAPEVIDVLDDVRDRLRNLEHAAELIKTVLIVKEPDTVHAANAFDGLRKQVVASASERRTHLTQLTQMAVAVSRATDVTDLRPQVQEWLQQAGIAELRELPDGVRAQDVFEGLDGASLDGATDLEVVEPAYVDSQTSTVVRLGRARRAEAVSDRIREAATDASARVKGGVK